MSTDIKERISTMGYLIVATEGLVDLSIVAAVDSTVMKAKGLVWNKSSMKKGGMVPYPGIYTGAK